VSSLPEAPPSPFMEVWVDSTKAWQNSGNRVDQNITAAAGAHTLTVYGRNSTGVVGSRRITFTVGSSTTCTPSTSTAVVICAPANGSTVTSPFRVVAVGDSVVTFMEVWVDSTKAWQNSGNSVDQNINAATGTHTLTVYGRNSTGVVGSQQITLTVP
jgi:hypothetical protein